MEIRRDLPFHYRDVFYLANNLSGLQVSKKGKGFPLGLYTTQVVLEKGPACLYAENQGLEWRVTVTLF